MIESQNISKDELISRLEENKKLYDSIQNLKKAIESTDSSIRELEDSTRRWIYYSKHTYHSEREAVISKFKYDFGLFAPTLSSGRVDTEERLNKFIQECMDYDIKYAQFRNQVILELEQLESDLAKSIAQKKAITASKKDQLEKKKVECKRALPDKERELDKTAVVPPRYYGRIQSLIEILYYKDINTLDEAMEYFRNEQRKLRKFQEVQKKREEERRQREEEQRRREEEQRRREEEQRQREEEERQREEEQRRRIEEEQRRNRQLLSLLVRLVETQEEEAQAMAERSKWEAKRFEEEKRMREQERDRARAIERKQRAEEFQKALNYSTAKREYDHASSLYESAVRQGRTIDAERLKADKEKAALEMLRNK